MGFLQTLTEKPWLHPDGVHSVADINEVEKNHQQKKIALRIFLVMVTVLFSLFIVTFLARSQYPDFVALAGDIWQPFYDPTALWINTAFLLVSSVSLHSALFALQRKQNVMAFWCVAFAMLFALQFLFAQLMLWRELYSLGYYVANNPANSYFYVFTAVHGLHLLGGILVLGRVLLSFRRHEESDLLLQSLQLCTTYWHYLLFLWLVLFALLTSSPQTYKALAALCGY